MNSTVVSRIFGALALALTTIALSPAQAADDGARRRTDAPAAGTGLRLDSVAARGDAAQLSTLRAYPLDQTLIARIDGADLSNGAFSEGAYAQPSDTAAAARAVVTDEANRLGVPLPEPGRTPAVLATIALALFFFLRRIV